MITKYLAIFRTSFRTLPEGTFLFGRVGGRNAFYLHVLSLRLYIRVGRLS